MRNSFSLFVLLLGLVLAGCGHNDGRQAVSGRITLDGEPLVNAAVSFRPVGHQANSSGTVVRDGKFQLLAAKGLIPGTYEVAIQAYRETGRMIHDPQRGEVPELKPIRFHADAPQEAVVRDAVPNVFEFHLQSAK